MSNVSNRIWATDDQNQAIWSKLNDMKHAQTLKLCVLKQHASVGSLSKATNSTSINVEDPYFMLGGQFVILTNGCFLQGR